MAEIGRRRGSGEGDGVRKREDEIQTLIDVHGVDSHVVRKACAELSDMLNGQALEHLHRDEMEAAKILLRKAELLTDHNEPISAVTYNNLACYYRRMNKLRTALNYLKKAQQIEMRYEGSAANPAGTSLNMCAVLSQLERHDEALMHARSAVYLIKEELRSMKSQPTSELSADVMNKMAVLAISYHNIGVEEEFLKQFDESIEAYKKGLHVAQTYLGHGSEITNTLLRSISAAKMNLAKAGKKIPAGRASPHLGELYSTLQQHLDSKRAATASKNLELPLKPVTSRPASAVNFDSQRKPNPQAALTQHRETDKSSAASKRTRPSSAFAVLNKYSAPTGSKSTQPQGDQSGKRGPVTPRMDEFMAARRRPVSATSRLPTSFRTPLGNQILKRMQARGESDILGDAYQKDILRGKLRPKLSELDRRTMRQTGEHSSNGIMKKQATAYRRDATLREHEAEYRDAENFIQEDSGSEDGHDDLLEEGEWRQQRPPPRSVLKPARVEQRPMDFLDHSKYESDEEEERDETGEGEVERSEHLRNRVVGRALGNQPLDALMLNEFVEEAQRDGGGGECQEQEGDIESSLKWVDLSLPQSPTAKKFEKD